MAVLSKGAFSTDVLKFRLRFDTVQHDAASRQDTIIQNDRLTPLTDNTIKLIPAITSVN